MNDKTLSVIPSISFDGIEGIKGVKDCSTIIPEGMQAKILPLCGDLNVYRMRVTFYSGYVLSIVKEVDFFGKLNSGKLFEIALFDEHGHWVAEEKLGTSDVVERYLTADEVLGYLRKTSKLDPLLKELEDKSDE